MIRLLSGYSAEVDVQDGCGETALLKLLFHGFSATSNYLLSQGADSGIKSESGASALYAALYGMRNRESLDEADNELLERLLSSGGGIRERGRGGFTPLYFCVCLGNSLLSSFCLEQGADPNAKTNVGLTPLDRAKHESQRQLIVILTGNGAVQSESLENFNSKMADGESGEGGSIVSQRIRDEDIYILQLQPQPAP